MQLIEQIQQLSFPAHLPETVLQVEQRFDAPTVEDVPAAVRQAMESTALLRPIKPGDSVAVAVGSRGIVNLPRIVRAAIARLKEAGAEPFVITAMGSHGGATAEGQRAMLAGLGITQADVGAEIRATMEVKPVGQLEGGPTLYQDVISAAADHTLLINRVKPHTDFRGDLESGLSKMCVIGLGKQSGAIAMHSFGGAGFQRFLQPAARVYEKNTNVLGGLAILENAYDQTADVVALTAAEIGTWKEEQLLQRARAFMASLPFPEIDVLVVQAVGKNISGTGMDTNIIGRIMIPRQAEPADGPDVAVIAVLDITDESHGNAAGIGMANVTTQRVLDKADWVSTYTNSVTSGIFGMFRVSIPMAMADDRRALEVAVRGCAQPQETARFVFIRNTLALDHIWVSPSMREQVENHPRLSIEREVPLAFDAHGRMTGPWQMS